MEDVTKRFAQVVVPADKHAAASGLHPVFEETRFGQTVMVFDGVPRDPSTLRASTREGKLR